MKILENIVSDPLRLLLRAEKLLDHDDSSRGDSQILSNSVGLEFRVEKTLSYVSFKVLCLREGRHAITLQNSNWFGSLFAHKTSSSLINLCEIMREQHMLNTHAHSRLAKWIRLGVRVENDKATTKLVSAEKYFPLTFVREEKKLRRQALVICTIFISWLFM